MIRHATRTLLLLAVAVSAFAAEPGIEYLDEARLLPGAQHEGVPVGGLSGLAYDPGRDLYHAVSDDRGRNAPPRFYSLRIDIAAGGLAVEVVSATTLRTEDGEPLPRGAADPEAIAWSCDGSLWIASEGAANGDVKPFLRRYGIDGTPYQEIELPAHYLPAADRQAGVRDNLGFEGLGLSPDGALLFAALENALIQDGPEADLGVGSPARILAVDLTAGAVVGEYLYEVEPVPDPPTPAEAFRVNGISGIAAVDRGRLLVLERSFSMGVGNRLRLYLVKLGAATDVTGWQRLPRGVTPVEKSLIWEQGPVLDNLEGMSFGPDLADGRRLMVMLSDDNFNPLQPPTVFMAMAVDGLPASAAEAVPIHRLQGAGHDSPLAGRCVTVAPAVVTAVQDRGGAGSAWIQEEVGDGDPATSEGLAVALADGLPLPAVGDEVIVSGRVVERGWRGGLSVSSLRAGAVEVVASDRPLPEPVRLGPGGRAIPPVVDDDGFREFQPEDDAADLFESLEGMRVRVDDGLVVGPTNRYGELSILADGDRGTGSRTRAGGVSVDPEGAIAQRIHVSDRLQPDPPMLRVGDRFAGPVIGVLDYSFGNYKVLNTVPLPRAIHGDTRREVTDLVGEVLRLAVATFNVENLSARSDDEKFRLLGRTVARHLRSPDLVALQEVQDDSGTEDDGTVSAAATLERLTAAIVEAGGPRYRWLQIDPVDGADGGVPGGNIRTAYLYNPKRLEFSGRDLGFEGARTRPGVGLTRNPALLAPEHPAFAGDPERGWEACRKPLVAEFGFNGSRLVVVNLHLSSKLGDDPGFGRNQPPRRPSEEQRQLQAEVVIEWVHQLLDQDPEAAVVVLGDLNEHEFRRPVRTLAGESLTNLIEQVPLPERYTYVFQGGSQVLDHILVSRPLYAGAEVDVVHVNADLPVTERGSDHDPVVARIRVPPPTR